MTLSEAAAHLHAGRPLLALPCIETHLSTQPADSAAWFLLGACKHALKDFAGASTAFSRSIELKPRNAEPYLALAVVAYEAGNADAALQVCEEGLAGFPSEPRLLHAAGTVLEHLGRREEALARYDRALAIAPRSDDTLHNRGLLLVSLGRLEDAESHYRAHLKTCPDSLRARAGLADVLLARGSYAEVTRLLQETTDAPMLVRQGFALAAQRRFHEARRAFAGALAADARAVERFVHRVSPGADLELVLSAENVFLQRAYAALCRCDWSRWEEIIDESRQAQDKPNVALEPAIGFMIRFLPLSGIARHAVMRRIAERIESRTPVLPPPGRRPARSRIRIGVLSPDFRDHLNADLLLPLFELLDRTRFDVYAYSLAADDGSAPRARIRGSADVFRDLQVASDDEAARLIRGDDVDVLVDAAGHTTGGRFGIVARRPARVQVNYLGFSCSLGSTRVDYAIADRVSAPSAGEWSESLAYVPAPFFLYDYRQALQHATPSRAEYGLPEDAFVFCAFHRAEKISPDGFSMWMEALSRTSRSILWLLAQTAPAAGNLRRQAALHGVDPSRLIFAPFEPRHGPRYLARQRLGGLFLDALHHTAATTACDALGAGLPLLTLPGTALSARISASLLCAAGLPELIAVNREAFVATAVRLAEDPGLLGEYRQRLIRNRSSAALFDTAARVRSLESAFEEMHVRAQRGEPPASFDV